ncbi:MAG: hypothetical protein H0X12_04010 [Nocardioides sp.]|nr:hypothetical protein [Nocardioides sp.]
MTSKVHVTTGEIAVDPYGFLEVPVSVRNDNSFPIEHVAVSVSLYDADDRLISIDTTSYNYTDPSTLAPGATGTYTAAAFANFEGLSRVRLSVEAFRP